MWRETPGFAPVDRRKKRSGRKVGARRKAPVDKVFGRLVDPAVLLGAFWSHQGHLRMPVEPELILKRLRCAQPVEVERRVGQRWKIGVVNGVGMKKKEKRLVFPLVSKTI